MKYRILSLDGVSSDELRQWFSEADAENQARLLRIKFPQAQKQSLAADHLARQMLSEHFGGAAITLRRDAQGKPFANLPLCFSLSHSGDFAVCAVNRLPVGVDIETLREVPQRTAQQVCSARELEFIYAGGTFNSTRFLQVWTAKEAYLKYLGCGIRHKLREVETVSADGSLQISGLRLHHEQADRYILSVVYEE